MRADLSARRWLRWHAFLLGALTLALTVGVSTVLHRAGVSEPWLRWPFALAGGYVAYLGLLWCWCRWLLSRSEANGDPGIDLIPGGTGSHRAPAEVAMRSGEGGDFGGGGASGSFDADGSASDAVIDGAGRAGRAVLEAGGDADEGIVVVVPLAAVIGVAVLIAGGLGIAVFGLFGVEVLLGVAVEIAFASAGGALAWRAGREGWFAHALARTFWPMLALLLAALLLGVAIDRWWPDATTLPQALKLLRG